METSDPSWGSPHPRLSLLISSPAHTSGQGPPCPPYNYSCTVEANQCCWESRYLEEPGALLSTDPPSSTVSNLVLTGYTIQFHNLWLFHVVSSPTKIKTWKIKTRFSPHSAM